MLKLLQNKKVLVVVAHPDDELLGLGGTLHRLVFDAHAQVHVVILGEGITSRAIPSDSEREECLRIHRENILQAQRCIGYQTVSLHRFPDNRFDNVNLLEIVKVVEAEKASFSPFAVFSHHAGDLNIDHQRTAHSVLTACRPIPNESVKFIFAFETPSSTEWQMPDRHLQFSPNVYSVLREEHIEAKIRGMECYQFERRAYPHPRSPEALRNRARYWGSAVGEFFAEPFVLVRAIE